MLTAQLMFVIWMDQSLLVMIQSDATMKPFDLLNADLSGTQLIEASAGTGKTYTIAGIYLRLILEKALTVEQILVVTFTKAATEELKERIYTKLDQARQEFEHGICADPLVTRLAPRITHRRRALQQLETALADFDRAAIFTIHGFCQRLLTEFAFETGSLYETELIADPAPLINEVAEDFWRQYLYDAPEELIGFLRKEKRILGPDYFFGLANRVNRPDIRIVPDAQPVTLESVKSYRRQVERTRQLWHQSKHDILQLLNSAGLNSRIYGKQAPSGPLSDRQRTLERLYRSTEAFLDYPLSGFPPFNAFNKLCASTIAKYTLKKSPSPRHPFFDSCEDVSRAAARLQSDFEKYVLWLKVEFVRYYKKTIKDRKGRQQVMFYDDLLTAVHSALKATGSQGNALVRAVRNRLRAALVDEFQDTDTLQLDIFTALFNASNSTLFMIGDPKQSIYSFRGADIFSYLRAGATAGSRATLDFNWRSAPCLLEALNRLFLFCRQPFIYDRIFYRPAVTPPERLSADTTPPAGAPLEFWFLPSTNARPRSKSEAEHLISDAVATEIGALLSASESRIDAGQMAVLVRTNRQARIVRTALVQKGIAAVLYRAGDVFDTREAGEMERLLSGIAEVHSESRLKAAVTTDLIGITGRQLADIDKDPDWWRALRERFLRYQSTWKQNGFIHMFNALLTDENGRARLLGHVDGQRRLTNVLHLAELIHDQDVSGHPGLQSLLKWFSRQRRSVSNRSQIHELRLESDERSVKVITIHMSKGLEFPIVFCPFCWEGIGARGQTEVFFHAHETGEQRFLDLGSENLGRHQHLADFESLAESLRLFYVAVTRAKRKCYVVWGRIKSAETSALAYLLHRPPAMDANRDVALLKNELGNQTDADMLATLKRLESTAHGYIQIRTLPLDTQPAPSRSEPFGGKLRFRPFKGRISRSWSLTSYTALVEHKPPGHQFPGSDDLTFVRSGPPGIRALDTESADPAAQYQMGQFPRGVRPGIFFHSILQDLDFSNAGPDHMQHLVNDRLRRHGYDPKWQPAVCDHLRQLRDIPLLDSVPELKLSRLRNKDRVNEMAFTFPVNPITSGKLERIFPTGGPERSAADVQQRLKNIGLSAGQWFLNGFIDMVFCFQGRYYIVDWKSNHLGDDASSYDARKLRKTMHAEMYVLQYLIYILALQRYLTLRNPTYRYDNDFGGVFYIFLRGIDPGAGASNGIYYDRPPRKLIEKLDRLLIPGNQAD